MSVSVRATLVKSMAQIEVAVAHPSHDGHHVDPKTGKIIAASFMQQLRIRAGDQLLAECNLGGGLADNPAFKFKARGLKAGINISVDWTDSKAATGMASTILVGGE